MNEDMKRLAKILKPVAEEIALCAVASEGIVFVVHRPGPLAHRAMAKLGVRLVPGKTTVFALSCADAAARGHDPVTRRWLSTPPKDDEIKVFLIAGEGTALLTLRFTDDGIQVSTPPNLRLV